MSIFDKLIKVDNDGNLEFNEWVKWNHFLIPDKAGRLREMFRQVMKMFGHCEICTSLSGCYFAKDNNPDYPLHKHCDCGNMEISVIKVMSTAMAKCPTSKFRDYVFTDIKKSKGKIEIFRNLGYNINNSEMLSATLSKQAMEHYINGDYILGRLDEYGQRITIPITLKGKSFYSGWLVYPLGYIKNTTPFTGWSK